MDQARYDDPAIVARYDDIISSLAGGNLKKYQQVSKKLLDLVPLQCDDEILEIGCGTGLGTQTLLERGFKHLYAIDRSYDMLEHAELRLGGYESSRFWINRPWPPKTTCYAPLTTLPRIDLIQHDAYNLCQDIEHLGDRLVDVAVCFNGYGSLTPEPLLSSIWNRLKPQGIFAFNAKLKTNHVTLRDEVERHIRRSEVAHEGRASYQDLIDLPGTCTIANLRAQLSNQQFEVIDAQDMVIRYSIAEAKTYIDAAMQRWRLEPNIDERRMIHDAHIHLLNALADDTLSITWKQEALIVAKSRA